MGPSESGKNGNHDGHYQHDNRSYEIQFHFPNVLLKHMRVKLGIYFQNIGIFDIFPPYFPLDIIPRNSQLEKDSQQNWFP